MINPEDEIIIDSRTSCTKDEAAAKLLGWMQGTIRKKYIKVTEHGIPEDQLAHLHSLDVSLSDQLVELREPVRQLLSKATKGSKEFSKMNEAVKDIDEVIKKAMSYLLDIDDELDKGENSALKIDHEATNKTGVIHIKLRSLDKWARLKYGIRILDNLASNSTTANSSDQESSSLVKWLRTFYYISDSDEAVFNSVIANSLRQASSGKADSGQALQQNDHDKLLHAPAVVETDMGDNQAQDKQEQVKPKRQFAQKDAILAEIKRLGHDPKRLPKRAPGKKGVKAAVLDSLGENELFTGKTTFKKAWDQLLHENEIIYVE